MSAKYTADEIAKMVNASYRGGEFFMKCPAHSDSQASLSFRDDPINNKILLTCHAGCDNKDIIAELVKMGLWEKSTSVSTVFYPYNDENGKEVFRVLRYGDKKFPVGKMIDDEFVSGLDGIEPILYRLDNLIKAPITDYVFITEGERDADTAARLGLTATTNCNGGNPDKWRDSYSEFFKDRIVVLLEDNDSMGVRRVTELEKKLNSIAQFISIVTFRDMPKGADLTDWVMAREAEGKSASEIKALLMAMVHINDISGSLEQFNSKSLKELESVNDLSNDLCILDGSLPANEPFALVGDPGCGKSTIALALGAKNIKVRLSQGLKGGKILYLLLEGNSRNISAVVQDLGIDPNDVIIIMNETNNTRIDMAAKIERDKVIKQILSYEQTFGVALVIYDSFSASSSDLSINDPKIGVIMQELNSALDQPGVPVCYINHCKKGQLGKEKRAVNISLGSGTFIQQVRTMYQIDTDDTYNFVRKLTLRKSNKWAHDPERDYYFIKHNTKWQFVSAAEFEKFSGSGNEVEADAPTMKARARKMIPGLFLGDRDMIPSNEIFEIADAQNITRKVMTESLIEMKVKTKRMNNVWYRYWPGRDLFFGSSNCDLPFDDTGHDDISGAIEEQPTAEIVTESVVEPVVVERTDNLFVEYMPSALVVKKAPHKLFYSTFDDVLYSDLDGTAVIKVLVKFNQYTYHFKVRDEIAINFMSIMKSKMIKTGDKIVVMAKDSIIIPGEATLESPLECLMVWPRVI